MVERDWRIRYLELFYKANETSSAPPTLFVVFLSHGVPFFSFVVKPIHG
jgi:hypothetical protein